MKSLVQIARENIQGDAIQRDYQRILLIAIAVFVVHLGWLFFSKATSLQPGEFPPQRNIDFPSTYIRKIHLNLTSPDHFVLLIWAGSKAANQAVGPFHSSPGAGWGTNDCNDPVESNCPDSMCTPKGLRKVEGFLDYLKTDKEYRYVTFIDRRRSIGFHAHPSIPAYPASQGCVRLEPYAARLIHDNSIEGVTEILIDGTWTNPRAGSGEKSK